MSLKTTGSRKRIRKVTAIAKWNRCFYDANQTKKRYRVLKGSAGSGKSVNVAQDYIRKLSSPRFQGANLLVVRKACETHRHSTFAELCAAVTRLFGDYAPDVWHISLTPLSMECRLTGCKILFRGMNDASQREKIKSVSFQKGKLTWIWMEEATEFAEADLDILDDRLRGRLPPGLYYQMTLTFNPVSAGHWIKRRFFDRTHPDIFTHHSTFLDNAFIDEGYARRMELRRRSDPEGYRVYALGEWGQQEGLILQNYQIAPIPYDFSDYDALAMGQDFGFNHANALLLVGLRDGVLYVLRELYVKGLDTGEILALAEGKFPRTVPMYCDSAEPDRIKTWRQHGYLARAVHKEPGSVRAQIDWLKGRPILIARCCEHTIAEIGGWQWQKDAQTGLYTDVPVPRCDDAMAALRYAVEGFRKGGQVSFT